MANNTPGTPAGKQTGEKMRFFKSNTQLVVVVTAALVLPVVIISAMIGASGSRPRATDEMSSEVIEARISPVAGFELRLEHVAQGITDMVRRGGTLARQLRR